MGKEPILKIKIEANGETVHLKGEAGEVEMIPFKGYVDGPIFQGIVVPNGVDTQIVNAAGVRHMSARYLLQGKDTDGQKCSIYVENNGWFSDDVVSMPFHTVPTFLTDSKKLSAYLHRNQFVGKGCMEEDGLWIYFYEIDHENGGDWKGTN
ncbi:MAG: DUF3237 domain-containing protein [Ruminococcus sp.]|nr:DUF3237 domain-containing protein [Ruminococcus sp.]